MTEKKSQKKAKGEVSAVSEGVTFLPIEDGWKVVEEYWVTEPYVKVKIVEIPELGGQRAYYVEEVKLTPAERGAVEKLVDILSVELEPPASFEVDVKQHVVKEARRLAAKYRGAVRVPGGSWDKVLYYIERDLVGYGPIEALMRDYKLEDISCDGVNVPIFVWHRDYESIPTNIVFTSRDALREFIVKLAHVAGKHISAAFPIVDAMLPGKHRLAATYGEEVSPKGSSFSARKFRERPFSVTELIGTGNLDTWTAAYLWLAVENRMTVIVLGATAAGKTTFLNAVTNFFKPGFKVVTVEETPELNLPHENWTPFVSRESYGLGAAKIGEITLYDLVRLSLRYRPDYIIVGEIRGAEAYVFFQAASTGHGGLCTMHAESLLAAVRRLTSPPMNVAPAYIPAVNVTVYVERTLLPDGRVGRRLRHLWEVEDYDKYREIVRWDPASDKHVIVGSSVHLSTIATRLGRSIEEVVEELERRRLVLEWMKLRDIKETREVFAWINRYYANPREVYERARGELELARLKPAPPTALPLPREEVIIQASPPGETVSRLRSLAASIRLRRQPLSREAATTLRVFAEFGGVADRGKVEERVRLPKELINKALSELVRRGLVEIMLPGTRYRITPEGKQALEAL